MKKFLIMLLCLILLCGCGQKTQQYLVSAIGVDYDKGLYTVSFETIIINSEAEGQKRQIINGMGRTLIEAVNQVKKQNTQPLMLSHCGIIAVGRNITRTKLKGVMRYCKQDDDITLSVLFIKTENAAKLLNSQPISSISVGYDLMNMIKTNEFAKQSILKNRLFEICKNENPILPIINTTEKGYYFEKF